MIYVVGLGLNEKKRIKKQNKKKTNENITLLKATLLGLNVHYFHINFIMEAL